jgi:two-component system sensor histidine kinase EvgS
MENLQLFGHSKVDGYEITLNEPEWKWLRNKQILYLGVSAPDYPPFDFTGNGRKYEGITADYINLISQLLHTPIQVRRFNSRTDVIQALKNGEIDLLGTANGFEEADPELLMSEAYAEDSPVLVAPNDNGNSIISDMTGKKISMLYHYLPPSEVRSFYPGANLQLYPSTLSAIGAVAFGNADFYLGDAIGANYLIGLNYLNNVHISGFSPIEGSRFAFALSTKNTELLRMINAAIASIPSGERMSIQRRWSPFKINSPGLQLLNFTAKEQHWMELHPRVTVAAMENFLPISFFDNKNTLQGIGADVLSKISARTGLKFDVVRGTSIARQIDSLQTGKVDMLIALTPSTKREEVMRFTRPYLSTPYVMISKSTPSSPTTLDEMAGKRLAIIRGMFLTDYVEANFPEIKIVSADNAAQVMEMVAKGDSDAGINSLLSSNYMISRQYRGKLQITSTVGVEPARFAFVTNRGDLELYSILEKALLNISPEEMNELISRWRSEIVLEDGFWVRNRASIAQGFLVAGLLLVAAVIWNSYLRRLIRRREEAERALNNQLEFKRALIDGTPHPIYVRDREGRMLTCNSSYLEVLGLSFEQVKGKHIIDGLFSNSEERVTYHAEYLQVLNDGVSKIQDRKLALADGRVLTIYHWMLPYKDSDGVIIGLIAGWIDISEREQLFHLAQEANRAKTKFLATMSHEIRTPLNAVIGMLEMVLKKSDQGVIDHFAIEVASGAAHGLLELIGDILDIARIESGKLSLTPGRANLGELIKSVVRIFEGLAQQKGLTLEMSLDARSDCDVSIDPLRFKQIISNLIGNSIKFTEIGAVRLILEVLSPPSQTPISIRILIEDNGQGISLEDQKQLFSPFTQATNSNQSHNSGSGLGLVISRTLCEMMGGSLSLTSVLGEGTQVEILLSLPLAKPIQVEEIPIPMEGQHRALKILVVDDYPANRMLLSKQLAYLGHSTVEAHDGASGLQAWRNRHFDAVITDCSMPVMNGYSLAKAIRAEETDRGMAACLIIGFTANAQPEEKERCLEAGMDDCLFKPISLEKLKQRLDLVSAYTKTIEKHEDIDFSALEELVKGDQNAIKALLSELMSSNQQDMDRLSENSFTDRLQELSDLAHKIKGGARIVKAKHLIIACEKLESACSAKCDERHLNMAMITVKQEMLLLAEKMKIHID